MYSIDPQSLAKVRDDAANVAKKNHDAKLIALVALADEILQGYTGAEIKRLQKKNYKIGIT